MFTRLEASTSIVDLYARFDLPPPPPPTIFSRDHTDGRARMPNFASVNEVSKFVDASRLWRHSRGANVFLIFATVYLLITLMLMVVGVLHKVYKRTLWVFRIVPRGHSKIIIPNVHNSWALFITPYIWILVASSIGHIIGDARVEPVININLWISMMWSPMLFAVWYQTWGLIASRVTASSDKVSGISLNPSLPPWLTNGVCLLVPAIPSVITSVVSAIGNAHFERARHGWYDWHAKYDGTSELTRDMVLDAQNVFHASIRGAYHVCISQIIWGTMCFLFGTAHSFATSSLIFSIGDHLRAKRRALLAQKSILMPQELPTHAPAVNRSMAQINPSELTAVEGISKPPLSVTCDSIGTDDQQSRTETRMYTFGERMHDQHISFFPPIESSGTIVHIEASKAERVLTFFFMQSVSITLGTMAFIADSLYMALHSYAAAEANNYESAFITGYIAVVIITLLAGTGSFVSMTHTTFEASFTALLYARRFDPCHSGQEKTDFLNMD
ncbi:hypothetical protein A4X06_0g4552 [Tilletia controversa]|uniref:Uncharacterized protein n=3 Tax=Tilletia TaxID=13289 RepID=A0A8X7SWE8_9BASI|nr:hypothetical protein CF328_g7344 [Tilletia controversa]KAE8247305.1 hypothetical protein A4X06_0g4552 [Tilletia controversa]